MEEAFSVTPKCWLEMLSGGKLRGWGELGDARTVIACVHRHHGLLEWACGAHDKLVWLA
jgi:hypothetical protein